MTSRRADDLPRQIAQLQRKVDELERLSSRQGHVHAVEGFMLLGEAVADGTSLTLEVTDIPQTHRDLLVMFHGSNVGSVLRAGRVRFNNNTGSVYRWVRMHALDNSASVVLTTDNVGTFIAVGAMGDDSSLTSMSMRVHSYTSSRNNGYSWEMFGSQGTGAGNSQHNNGSGAFVSTAAITSVQFFTLTDNISSGSTLRVYGLGLI